GVYVVYMICYDFYQNLPSDAAIGVDPWCVSIDTAQIWEHALAKKQKKLVQTCTNIVDEVWKNRPPPEIKPVFIHPLEFAGCAVAGKLTDLREKLAKEKARGIIITALDEVAWLYNIRGNDMSYNPVVHAFAIVTSSSAFFYVDKKKVSAEVYSYMEENGIEVRDYDAVSSDVALLATGQLNSSETKGTPTEVPNNAELSSTETENGEIEAEEINHNVIWLDPGSCCHALYYKLNSDEVLLQQSPLALAKAIKSDVDFFIFNLFVFCCISSFNFSATLNHLVFVRLDHSNFLLWKSQVLPIVRGHGHMTFLDGSSKCTPAIIVSITSPSHESTQIIDNPDFIVWQWQDQLLLGWILSSLTEYVLA
ncbi:aminopeptidase P1-like, partial [Macadamia integrifolia]|uniref:aminopeptidase P1-like n=1 Tax=Macadamia integrifolia TaxID=60698 RepID=UPI001C4EB518